MALIWPASAAVAHPLGNFTTNRFSGLEIGVDEITVHYIVDFAEIAAFQEIQDLDVDGDDDPSSDELQDYAGAQADALIEGLSLNVDGEETGLELANAAVSLKPGQGGLQILRLEVDFTAPLADPEATIEFVDENYASKIGWKEVIAYPSGDQGIADADVPATSASDALRTYPEDMLSEPLDVTEARVEVRPGAGPGERAGEGERAVAGPDSLLGGRFLDLVDGDLSPGFLVLAILIALGTGALHALGPGHGKTVMAAYLVGAEGKVRHAVTVGVAVSLMHTASVVILGMITLWASSLFSPEDVYPWLSLLAGLVVVGVGGYLLRARLRRARASSHHDHHDHDDDHEHDHDHDHGHAHGFGAHTHSHDLPAGVSPLSRRGLGAIALAGGLLPSPAALIVLLGSISLHRVALGVLLVTFFSIGLAGALTAVGILVLKARDITQRRIGARSTMRLQVAAAASILAVGLILTAQAVTKF